MDWQGFAELIAIAVFIWYLRKDSKDDYVRLETKLEEWRKETNAIVQAIRDDIKQFHREYQEETKNFHGRICSIEERQNQIKSQ